jgi:hypothetical protein
MAVEMGFGGGASGCDVGCYCKLEGLEWWR